MIIIIIIFEPLPCCDVGFWAPEWSSQLSSKPAIKDKHLETFMSPRSVFQGPHPGVRSGVPGEWLVAGSLPPGLGNIQKALCGSTTCSKVQKGPVLRGEPVKCSRLKIVKLPSIHRLGSGICWGTLGSLLLWSCWGTVLVIKPLCSMFQPLLLFRLSFNLKGAIAHLFLGAWPSLHVCRELAPVPCYIGSGFI